MYFNEENSYKADWKRDKLYLIKSDKCETNQNWPTTISNDTDKSSQWIEIEDSTIWFHSNQAKKKTTKKRSWLGFHK